MRVGIWCDYGFTLEPTEGIGVFVANLAKGIVNACDQTEVILVPHPGRAVPLASLVKSGRNRIRIANREPKSWIRRKAKRRTSKGLERFGYALDKLGLPLPQALEKLQLRLSSPASKREIETLERQCDLWLIPYVGTSQRFRKPTVVSVHDLVAYHFDDVVRPHQLKNLKTMVDIQVGQARRLACMSEFIREHDLVNTLGVARSKTKVIKPAVPSISRAADSIDTPPKVLGIERPFVFYPAAFRTYKNHRLIVESLQHLQDTKLANLQVVFTGIRSCPRWLTQHIKMLSAQSDVVCLGKVDGQTLASLYRHAFATVVPSLYEQGSFPIMEAIHHGCPALCSDIPALREQFGGMKDSMLYFDPHDAKTLASALVTLESKRSETTQQQQLAFRGFAKRSWTDAASEWLALFKHTLDTPMLETKSRQVRAA